MNTSWPRYLLAAGIVIMGLNVIETVSPKNAILLAMVIILALSIIHPEFYTELVKIFELTKEGIG